ncbi:MAG: DUF6325 family protein [Aeromicrobium sp.]
MGIVPEALPLADHPPGVVSRRHGRTIVDLIGTGTTGGRMATGQRPAGPVDLEVLGFTDPDVGAMVSAAVERATATGAVRVLDAIWIRKDVQGAVTIVDADDQAEAEALLGFPAHEPGLLSEDDVAEIAASIPEGTAAAVIAWENLWAVDFTETLAAAGGFALSHDRLPGAAVEDLLDILDDLPTSTGAL